jgi:hypothetical protein
MKKILVTAAVVACVAAPMRAWTQTQTPPAHPAMTHGASMHNDAAVQLKQDMRKLWTDHVVWTREYIIAATTDSPDQKAAVDRLMKNQDDIGQAIAKFYGAPAGQQLTTLLKAHISTAADVVKGAKSGDTAAFNKANEAWKQNADQIAEFLSKANPNWPKATLQQMMSTHLATTTDEVKARLSKNWDADVKAYDAVYDHILKMADALSDGIIKQFPDKFHGMS